MLLALTAVCEEITDIAFVAFLGAVARPLFLSTGAPPHLRSEVARNTRHFLRSKVGTNSSPFVAPAYGIYGCLPSSPCACVSV